MSVGIHGDLDRAVSHLLFHIDNRGTVLEKERPEGMTEIVQANPANAGLGQARTAGLPSACDRELGYAF
jgi:hypothetical protein